MKQQQIQLRLKKINLTLVTTKDFQKLKTMNNKIYFPLYVIKNNQ